MSTGADVRARLWTELPKKVDFAPSLSSFPDPRMRAVSSVELERMRLRFRTESNLVPESRDSPLEGSLPEEAYADFTQSMELRYRFRTESSFGMPVSPWANFDGRQGLGSSNMGMIVPVPAFSPPTPYAEVSSARYLLPMRPMMAPQSPYIGEQQPYMQSDQIQLPSLSSFGAVAQPSLQSDHIAESSSSTRTTVMLRNLPSCFTRSMLVEFLDSQGFAGRYDFAYLPLSFDTLASLTHAFLNMITSHDAERVRARLEGFTNWAVPSDSVCNVLWNDKHQGLAPLIERYRNSPVMHQNVPEDCKPMLFHSGKHVQFPSPTQRIKAPKICRSRM